MHIWGAAVFKLYNWRMCFSSSKVLERLGILKHDFSIFDDGDFEDVRTTWRERCRRWGSRTSVNIGRSGEPREGGGLPLNFLDQGFFGGGIEFTYFCYVLCGECIR